MSLILNISDFDKGRNRIPVDPQITVDLQAYIDKFEEKVLLELFGVVLYDLFKTDYLGNTPNAPTLNSRFEKVFEPFAFQNDCDNNIHRSEGMKEMLKGIIYFYWTRDQYTKLMHDGIKISSSENSKGYDMSAHDVFTRYNNSGETFEAIQLRMSIELVADFSDYKGVPFDFILPL